MKKNALFPFFVLSVCQIALAQKKTGNLDNQEVTIEKSRKIEFPAANRLFDKLQPIKGTEVESKIRYDFRTPKLGVSTPLMMPSILKPIDKKTTDEPNVFENYVKIGAGNYGKIYGEAFVGTKLSQDLLFDVHYKHLSNQTGPVAGKSSGNSENRLKIDGRYLTNNFKIDASLLYNRDNYFFYGRENVELFARDSLRQTVKTVGGELSFENANNESAVDYSLKTGFYLTNDRYSASETDWGSNFKATLPIVTNFYALFSADAYVSQRVDAETFNRNFFRVKPAFKYTNKAITVTAAFNAVNETDNRLGINRTVGFPVVAIDVAPVGNIHFFVGIDGDISRNTLRSLLAENRWLDRNVVIANTEKSRDLYAGTKGEIGSGFSYEAKVSYARYKNFYVFNNSLTDTSKFSVLYDANTINVLAVSAQVGYSVSSIFRTVLKAEAFDFGNERLERAWQRPTFTANLNASIIFSKKMFVTADVYLLQGMRAQNFASGQFFKMKPIIDANLKIDYLLTPNFSAFVSLNNLGGQTYERFLYYRSQGLNFLGGLAVSF